MAEDIKESNQQKVPFVHPGSPNLNRLYANGFIAGRSSADMYLIGLINSAPNFVLNMSLTTAKNLQILMNKIISDYEASTGTKIETSEEINAKMRKLKK